jgi:PAS domain S-box-containing protein
MSGPTPERRHDPDRERAMHNIAVRTSNSILILQRRAELERLEAKALLEERSKELMMSVSLLNATLESAPDGILAVDLTGRIAALNRRFAAIWGLSAETVREMSFDELVAFEARFTCEPEAFLQRKTASYKNPEVEAFDVVEFTDGRTFERKAVPQRVDGRAAGIVVHWRDITEQRRSDDAQLALAEQLRQAQKMESLGALSGGIAHDFNNILSAILGNAELALAAPASVPDVVESLTAIREATERAARLVQQILTFSRQQPHEQAPLRIDDTVNEAVRLLRATVPAGIELATQLDPDAPLIFADATQLHQIVMNLCTNAMHALKERPHSAGRSGRIDVLVDTGRTGVGIGRDAPGILEPGRFVRLRVRDNGVGMDEQTRNRIFEPFFTTRATGEGTGLGLSVVHGIMETHHGAIAVESAPGVGTTFALYFPAIDDARRPRVATPRYADAASRVEPGAEPMRVLYVDDDEMIVSLVSRLLAKAGCTVTGFSRAQLALEALRAQPMAFDVVVTDFNMPELSGLDIARSVLERRPNLPVVITSGYITTELQREARAIGVTGLLYKPDLAKRLLQIIRALPRSSRA